MMWVYALGATASTLGGCVLSLFGDRFGLPPSAVPIMLTATVGTALFALVAIRAASDESHLELLARFVAIGHAFGLLMTAAALIVARTDGPMAAGSSLSVRQVLYGFLLVDITVSTLLFWQLKAIERSA